MVADVRLILQPTRELMQGLIVGGMFSLSPREFWRQQSRASVAAVWLFPSSHSLTVSHRKLGARTQTRWEIPPGACLWLGPQTRREWSVAIPPLRQTVEHEHTDPTRRLMVLLDPAMLEPGAGQDSLTFDVHEPRR